MNDNARTLAELYRLWGESRGTSVDAWVDAMHPEIEMGSVAAGGPGLEFTRTLKGLDEARTYFTGLDSGLEMVSFDVKEFVAEGDTVVALIEMEWRSKANPAATVRMHKADVHRFEGGKIKSFFDYFDTGQFQQAMSL